MLHFLIYELNKVGSIFAAGIISFLYAAADCLTINSWFMTVCVVVYLSCVKRVGGEGGGGGQQLLQLYALAQLCNL